MKKTVLVAGLALAASVVVAPVAAAQELAPMQVSDCAAAVTALNRADEAHRAAVEADEKAAAAEAADKAAEDTEKALEAARDAAVAAGAPSNTHTQGKLDALREELEGLKEKDNPTDADRDRRVELEEKIPLIAAVIEAEKAHADAKAEAAKTNAEALVAEARKTNADELKKALDEAKADFDRLCGGEAPPTSAPPTTEPSETPEPDPVLPEVDLDCRDFPLADGRTAQDILNEFPGDPHGLDADEDRIACEPGQDTAADSSSDFEDPDEVVVTDEKVAVPQGGVQTGVGPA